MREAGLQVDEIPKLHVTEPTQEHHSVYDSETKLRIHLKLNGVFSYFWCIKLTHDEIDKWEEHNVVFLTQDAESWNPNNEYCAEVDDGMLDVDGDITMRAAREKNELISAADISSLYDDSITWDCYKTIVDEQLGLSCVDEGSNFSDDDTYRLNADPIFANICDVSSALESETFLAAANGNMKQSKIAMALGGVTKDDFSLELFEMI